MGDEALFIEISVQCGTLIVTVVNISGGMTAQTAGLQFYLSASKHSCDKGSNAVVLEKQRRCYVRPSSTWPILLFEHGTSAVLPVLYLKDLNALKCYCLYFINLFS
jgi:hypothetical protein